MSIAYLGPAGTFAEDGGFASSGGHRDLTLDGHAAIDWMSRAQAFAGAPTDGPAPGGAA